MIISKIRFIMKTLKRFDLFKSINSEAREGSNLGSVLTLVSFVLLFGYILKEIRVYKTQQVQTQMSVNKLTQEEIKVSVDIIFYKIQCQVL